MMRILFLAISLLVSFTAKAQPYGVKLFGATSPQDTSKTGGQMVWTAYATNDTLAVFSIGPDGRVKLRATTEFGKTYKAGYGIVIYGTDTIRLDSALLQGVFVKQSDSTVTFVTPTQLTAALSTYIKQDGNSFGAAAVIGTNDNNPVNIETNGVTRATIAANGNISTTENLSISKSKTISTALLAVENTTSSNPNSNNISSLSPNMPNSSTLGVVYGGKSLSTNNGFGLNWTNVSSGSASNYISFNIFGVNNLLKLSASRFIEFDGNVGINTTTDAGYRLDVTGKLRASDSALLTRVRIPSTADGTGTKMFVPDANGNVVTADRPIGDIKQEGNTFADTVRIGTNDNFPIRFETNGVDRVQVRGGTTFSEISLKDLLGMADPIRFISNSSSGVSNTYRARIGQTITETFIDSASTIAMTRIYDLSNDIYRITTGGNDRTFELFNGGEGCIGCSGVKPPYQWKVRGSNAGDSIVAEDELILLGLPRGVQDSIPYIDANGRVYIGVAPSSTPELSYDEATAKLTYPNNYREEKIVTGASSDRTPHLSVFTGDSYTDHNAVVYYTSIDSSYWMRIAKTEGIPYRNFALSGAGINYTNFITHKMINPGHRISLKIMAGFNDHSGPTADSIRARRQDVNGKIVAALNQWSRDTSLAGGGDVTRSGTWTVVDWNDYGGKGNNHALTATAGDSITYPFTDSTAYAVLFTAGGVRNSYSKNVVIKLDHVPIDTISLDSAAHELLLAGIRGGSTGTYRENIALLGYKISTTYGAHEYTIVNLDNDTMAVSHFGVLEPVSNSMDVQLFSIPTLSNAVPKYHTSYKADSAINSIRGGRPYYHFDLYPTTTNSWASQSPDPNHWGDTGHLGAYLVWKSVITPTLRPQAAVNAVSIGGEDLFRGSYNDVTKATIDTNGDGYFHDNTVTILKSGICFNCYPTDSVYVYRFKNKGRAYMYLQRNDTAFEFASSISGEADAQITWLTSSFKTTNGTAKAWLPAKVMIGDPTGFNTITYQGNASIDSIYYAGNHWYNKIRSNAGEVWGTHLATPTPSSEWKVRIDPFDKVTINIPVLLGSVAEYADNAAALSAGLTAGMVYRTGDNLKIVH